VLVDLRPSHDGFLLTKETVRYPYDLILGSKKSKGKTEKKKEFFLSHINHGSTGDRGMEEKLGTATRSELLSALKEDELDKAVYLQAGKEALDAVRHAANDATLDHAGAQAYLRTLLKLAADPPALADAYAKQKALTFQFSDAGIKNAYAKGKPAPELDQYITNLRAAFERFTTMKPLTHSRFATPPAGDAERADLRFSEQFLQQLRPVLGEAIDHAGAAETLKKRFKPDTLKSNKAFVEFFSAVATDYNKALTGVIAGNLRKQTELTSEQSNFANQLGASFAWYLKFSATPTKEQLAAHLGDAELARRAGRFLANMDDSVAQRTRELAKQALTQLPKQRPLYLICLAQAHSDRAAAALKEAGASDVYVVDGGVDNWLLSGVPTEYNATMSAKLDDAIKAATRGAPTSLSDINE